MIDNILMTNLTGLNHNVLPITVVTGLQYNTSLVKIFNNITFLYDPNWKYQQGEPTYPIAFFYVKSMTEQMNSDISQRPMLFYNAATDAANATRGGLLNIVADNIVIKPKTYKLEIIVPANGTTLKNSSFSFDAISNVNSFIFSCGSFKGNTELATTSRIVNISLGFLETLFKGLYGTSISVGSIFNSWLQQQDYNKTSLEYMWANRRILKLKLWNGWKFKYLAIKDFEITKTGENGDFYEGSLTCQDVPILTFRNQKGSLALSNMARFSSNLGELQKKTVDTFIKKMTATYEG